MNANLKGWALWVSTKAPERLLPFSVLQGRAAAPSRTPYCAPSPPRATCTQWSSTSSGPRRRPRSSRSTGWTTWSPSETRTCARTASAWRAWPTPSSWTSPAPGRRWDTPRRPWRDKVGRARRPSSQARKWNLNGLHDPKSCLWTIKSSGWLWKSWCVCRSKYW